MVMAGAAAVWLPDWIRPGELKALTNEAVIYNFYDRGWQANHNLERRATMDCPVCKKEGKANPLNVSDGISDAHICDAGHLFIDRKQLFTATLEFKNPGPGYKGRTDFGILSMCPSDNGKVSFSRSTYKYFALARNTIQKYAGKPTHISIDKSPYRMHQEAYPEFPLW